MKKNLMLIAIIILTIVSVYALVQYSKMDSFSFAWALNFLLMLCVFIFTGALNTPLSSPYFKQRVWEQKGKIYDSIGIHLYRKILVWIGWESLTKKSKPVEKNTQTLVHLHSRTKTDELGHLFVLIIVLGFNIFVAFKYGILKSLWLLFLNILLNLYPVLLQRYNRPRIERAINLSKLR